MRLMVTRFASGAAIMLAAVVTGTAFAQSVYPAGGQSPQQQQKDMAECQGWASQNVPNPAAVPPPQGGQGVRTAARGAAAGAVGGAIGGNAGMGAAIGAATGALVGGMRRRDERRAYEQSQAQASAAHANAYSACLQGRGYTVR